MPLPLLFFWSVVRRPKTLPSNRLSINEFRLLLRVTAPPLPSRRRRRLTTAADGDADRRRGNGDTSTEVTSTEGEGDGDVRRATTAIAATTTAATAATVTAATATTGHGDVRRRGGAHESHASDAGADIAAEAAELDTEAGALAAPAAAAGASLAALEAQEPQPQRSSLDHGRRGRNDDHPDGWGHHAKLLLLGDESS